MSRRPFDCRNNDYVTAFHFTCRPPVEDSQRFAATDMDNGLCGLLNACHWVTITHRHTDASDSPMFTWAPILPMSNIRCANRPNSKIDNSIKLPLNPFCIKRHCSQKNEPWIFFARFGSLRHFAASAQLKFGSLWLECFSAQLLRLRLRLPGLWLCAISAEVPHSHLHCAIMYCLLVRSLIGKNRHMTHEVHINGLV